MSQLIKKKFPSIVSIDTESDGNTSFLRAARNGQLDKVLEYLKSNIDINTSNSNGLNALHLASKDGHVEIVEELLKRGAVVDAATKKGNTALHIASLAGQEEVVKLLVQHGASVNVQSQNGFTPLYMAAQENHDNVVKFLLSNGANQSLSTEDGFTPLAVAMQQGHDKVVAVLLENDTRGKVRLPALHIAAKKDDVKAAKLLLENDHNADVTSKSGFTPLHIASHYGNQQIANLLIQKGADVNYAAKHNITPLHVAAKWGKTNMVSLLLENGATIEAKTRDGLTPLHCAARSGHEQVVDMLLERGAPISSKTKNGLAPLHMAAQGDHVDAARILLYHRAPVDEVTVDYLTALHVAAHCGHVRVAKLLLDRQADANARALNGFTPLHIACKKNRIKVVELLLKHGGNISATTESGLTPLHVASFMGCMNIVIYLLQHDANPDVPTVRGETPLHLAARANQTDIIRILLRNGAQVDVRAREQQTPLHIASRLGNADIVALLLQHGAKVDNTTKDMYTSLHIAAKEGQDEVASLLWDNGASLHAVTKKGFTPLHLAAKYGHLKVAKFLLKKEAPVDAQGKNGVTPLHVALHYDHQDVASVLLDKGASPHSVAKNGHTPLHIAARKNQMDIANTLLEYGANPNAESKAGFTPLHLSAQEGHNDMAALLLEHKANVNQEAKNGLTPLHLCAQEDRVPVAEVLVKNGVDVNAATKTGYTPLHIACHYGQINMVRFLLQNGAKIESTTSLNYTPLHQAAQQGHANIVNILIDNKADPDATTTSGQTPIMIAQKLGYITVIENLKLVSNKESSPKLNSITSDEKYRVQAPELMHETFMSDSEEEGGEDIILGDHQTYRYLTADEMKSLGDDSLPIDVTRDERIDSNRMVSCMDNSLPPQHIEDSISPEHITQNYVEYITKCVPDNTEIDRYPVNIGKLHWKNFLVSFLVDARGGAMRGCRHSGVRVIVPPRCAPSPTRITCRYVRPQRTPHPPPLMEGEALASRVLELGPVGAKFLGPVIIEVPHFAALRDKEREIVILRSDNGENWKEHTVEATEDVLNDVLHKNFEADDLNELEDVSSGRITRIVTQDFPQYFAVVSRIRQEVHAIGPEGGMVSSTVVPQVQAVFPEGALTKKIKVGLQAQPIDPELTAKLLGHGVAVSPVVTVEPRRRKFHKAITLTMPAPKAHSQGMINQYSGSAPTLRLLCSITGGTTRAQWEDVTGSTPLTFVNDCVSFTTTVSARFWLMDCRNISDATKMATELYKEAIHVPFMAKFVVFAKRVDPLEARLRVFCMTDDKEDKTLEHQEHFTEVAKSRDVEVLEGKQHYVEFAGNLIPVTKSGEQLSFCFRAFKENRLPFTVRVKDQHAEAVSRCLFMKEPRVPKGEPPQQPICILNIVLPDDIVTDTVSLSDSDSYKKYTILSDYHRPDPRIADMSNLLGDDWVPLANQLGLTTTEINVIKSEYPESTAKQAQSMLRMWLSQSGSKAQMNTLENALRRIGREDIITHCLNVDHSVITRINQEYSEPYREKKERYGKDAMAKKQISPKLAKEEEDDEKRTKMRDKYSAEEKEQPEEEEEEEEEEEAFDKPVSERRQKIEKRLSAERTIPASSQRKEIVQEITSIKQQSLVEDKLAEVQQKVLEHEEKAKTVITKTVTTKQDNKTLSKEEKTTPSPVMETMKALAEEAHKTVEEKFMKGVTQRLEQKTTNLSTNYEAQKSPKFSKTPPPSPADFLFREQSHASQEWESQKDELRVNKQDGTADKKETCNVHLTEASLTPQSMPLPKPRAKMLDTTDFHSTEKEVPTKPKSPVRDDLLDEDEVPESYSDKKKFWENVTQDQSHKRYSLQETVSSEKETLKRKQLSVQEFSSGPVPKPRTLHSSQSLVETASSMPQERSENTSSKTSDEDISIQERKQKNILSFDLKITSKKDKKKKVSTDELAQKGSGQISENLGYISDSEDVEHYISDSEIEDRVPQIRDRMMSVFVPSASSTACRSIYERSASLPTEDLYEVSARTIKARKEYYEEQIRKEMIEEQLTSELEEEPSPERKNLLLSSTEEDHTEADAKSIGEDVEDIREEHAYDAKKKIDTKSIDQVISRKVNTEERISSSSKFTDFKSQSDYIEEMTLIQKSKLDEPRNGMSRITHEEFPLKDIDKDNEHKLFETQHSISSDKSGDHIDEQNFKDDSHSTKPDSMEVLVDKSELEDSEKIADLDQDLEDTELKNNNNSENDDRRDILIDEQHRDISIKLPQENVQNVVWEVSVESACKSAFNEQTDDLKVQEVVKVSEKTSDTKPVSKIPVLKKAEQSQSITKEIKTEAVSTDKKTNEKRSKIPELETKQKSQVIQETADSKIVNESGINRQKLLDETEKFLEQETNYNLDYSRTGSEQSHKEQAKTSKYSELGFESSYILPTTKKDQGTKIDGTHTAVKIDPIEIKDDIQRFIEMETTHITDYTSTFDTELHKPENNENKEIQNLITGTKLETGSERNIKTESKHLTDHSKNDNIDITNKISKSFTEKDKELPNYLSQEKLPKKDKVKEESTDLLEHKKEETNITESSEGTKTGHKETSTSKSEEKNVISKVKENNQKCYDSEYHFEQNKLKTDTEQFIKSESKHITDHTNISKSNNIITKQGKLDSENIERKIENIHENVLKDEISENSKHNSFLDFESPRHVEKDYIITEKHQVTDHEKNVDTVKKTFSDTEKVIDNMQLSGNQKVDIEKFLESESKHKTDYTLQEIVSKETSLFDKCDTHVDIEKQQMNEYSAQMTFETQKFLENESQHNTDYVFYGTNKEHSKSNKTDPLIANMSEKHSKEKDVTKTEKIKLGQEVSKDHEEKTDIKLFESSRIIESFIESESKYNTDFNQTNKLKKDNEKTEKVLSEASKKLHKIELPTTSTNTEEYTEKHYKLKTETQTHSEIEKLIFDCLQQQKVHPDEALKIANALVEEIEAEIQKHDSLSTEPIEKLEEKTNIPEFLRHLAETKGLDQREVELVESVLARKKRGLGKLSRGDTQASSVEITDEDLKYSGTDLEYSQVLEQQIDQLEAEKVSNLDSESLDDPSDNSQSKTTFTEKTGEEHSEDTEWSHDYGSNADVLAMKKDGYMKTHENVIREKTKTHDDKICSEDDKNIKEKKSEESEISKTKVETIIGENSHVLLKDGEIKTSQIGNVEVQAAHISNVAHDKINIVDKDKPEQITLEHTHVTSNDNLSAIYNAETYLTEMSKDTVKQISTKTEEKYDELNKNQEAVLKKESVSIKVADDGSQIQTKEDVDKTFSVKSSTTITQTHQREETSSTTVTEDTGTNEMIDDELLKELESGAVKTIVETHEVVRRTSSNELKDIGYSKKDDSDSPSVVLRKSKSDTSSSSPKTKPDRKSGYDYEINSSSGESHYQSFEMDSNKSRPCSSDIEGLLAAGSSEYESALTSQIYSAKSQISTDYKTVSSMSSKDSMKSLDSESSGNLASVEVSEHSETLVPSTSDLDDILDSVDHQLLADESELNEQNLAWSNRSMDTHNLNEVSDSEGLSFTGVDESMEASEEESPEAKATEVTSKMKRSCEMTFQPEPKVLAPESPHADLEDKIGTSLDDGSIFSTSMSSTSSTGAQRTVIEQSRADSDRLEGSMNVSSEHLSLEDVDSIPRGSIDGVMITSNLTTSGSPTTHAEITFNDDIPTLGDGNQITHGKQFPDDLTSTASTTAPEPKKKGHKRTESTVLMGTLTRFSTELESDKKTGEKIGSQPSSKEISLEDKQDTDEKDKCDTRTSSQVSSLDKEFDVGTEIIDDSKSQSQSSKWGSGDRVTVLDDKFERELTNIDKLTDRCEGSTVLSSSIHTLEKNKFDDGSSHKCSKKDFEPKDRDHFDRLGELHHEKKSVEEGEAEAVFSMVPPTSPAHKIKEIQPILEDEIAEKHELESQERIKKDRVVVTNTIIKDTSPVPDIKITQHMAPLVDNNFHYPELELESKEKQQEQQEVQTDTPQTPASNSSKSSEDTDQGREYVINESVSTIPEEPEGIVEDQKKEIKKKQVSNEKKGTDSPDSSDSFEMLEKPDLIDDFVVIEEVGKEAQELDTEGKSVKIAKGSKPTKKHDEEVEQYLAHSAPTPLTRMTDIKYYPDGSSTEGAPFDFEESPPQVTQEKTKKEYDTQYDKELEANRKWVEQQFQGDHATMMAAGYGYEMDFERGPLEDIKEEDITDFAASSYGSQKDSGGSVKESYSSTPEYDVLAGRKYFTRSGEHDDTSMSSLQEFENLEQAMSLEMRRLHQGSQDSSSNGSFKARYTISKSGQGDDISVSSLKEFEGLEKACIAVHKIEVKVKEEEALLAQIDEGQESIASESESCETISGTEKKVVNDTDEEDYEKRMFEIDEIIKQAQSNVERFVDLKDVEQTESLGRGDSVEEVSKVPDLDLDTPVMKSTIKVQWKENEDVMVASTDSLDQQIGRSSRHDSADSLDQETVGNIMTTSTDSIEAQVKRSSKDNIVSDSIEGHRGDKNYIVSSDSLDLAAAVQRADNNALMTDSIDEDSSKFGPYDHSTSSTGKDLNSSAKDDFSQDKDDEHHPDNLDISSSTATHATYQYETDSVFSGSFTSGGSNTMVSSTNSLDQTRQGTSVDIAAAVRKVWFDEEDVGDRTITEIADESSKPYVTEIIEPSSDDYYSHVIHRKVELPPEVRKITFTGVDADEQMKKFLEDFKEGEECVETEEIDSDGNVHIKKVLTRRIVVKDDGGQQAGPEIEEYFRQLNQPEIVKGKGIIGTNLNEDKEGKHEFSGASTSKSITKTSRDVPETSMVSSEQPPTGSSIKASRRRPLRCEISIEDQTEVDPREHDWRFNLPKHAEGEEGSDKEDMDKKTNQHQ